mmetsp:Transcript_18173/g.37261  ORF Transcript_18173/g.37261 Transcript_18173/m.37261 type:complete len:294 (+) Transcript_18173:752-1633(+)
MSEQECALCSQVVVQNSSLFSATRAIAADRSSVCTSVCVGGWVSLLVYPDPDRRTRFQNPTFVAAGLSSPPDRSVFASSSLGIDCVSSIAVAFSWSSLFSGVGVALPSLFEPSLFPISRKRLQRPFPVGCCVVGVADVDDDPGFPSSSAELVTAALEPFTDDGLSSGKRTLESRVLAEVFEDERGPVLLSWVSPPSMMLSIISHSSVLFFLMFKPSAGSLSFPSSLAFDRPVPHRSRRLARPIIFPTFELAATAAPVVVEATFRIPSPTLWTAPEAAPEICSESLRGTPPFNP